MKRALTISLIGIFLLMQLVSCNSSSSISSLRTVESRSAFVSVPLIVEYDTVINQVVTDTSTFNNMYYEGNGSNYSDLKRLAMVNCCKKHQCDVLVNPSYVLSNKSGVITIIISGLPARYKKIRQATASDLWMLKFIEQNNIY